MTNSIHSIYLNKRSVSSLNIIKKHTNRISICALSLIVLSSCSALTTPGKELAKNDATLFETPLREPKILSEDNSLVLNEANNPSAPGQTVVSKIPSLSIAQQQELANSTVIPKLDAQQQVERLTFNNMTVGAFINEIFGNQLGLSFIIQPQVSGSKDLVSMRIASPLKQTELYKVAIQTLQPYGIASSLQNGILTFSFSEEASQGDTPLLISGRALPDVPVSNRPIFYVYPLKVLSTPSVRSYVQQLFKKNELTVSENPFGNALIFKGSQAKVEQAIAATKLFDRPNMNGMFSRMVSPSISDVVTLSANLESVLKAEGFAVRSTDGPGTAIRLLPLESIGKLLIFSKSQETLEHALNWVANLEVEQQSEIEQGLFSYQVQSTLATHIVEVLNTLGVANYSGSNQRNDSSNSSTQDTNGRAPLASVQTQNRSFSQNSNVNEGAGRYTVDEQLNTILFSGSGKDWLRILPIIKRLDRPSPSVMVEVVLVEVQLNDNENTGVEWLANGSIGGFDLGFGTLGGLGLGGGGFNLSLDSAGQTRALINAFYENSKATIRSRPRLMVKSGGEATIDVGNQIPVLSSNSQSVQAADAPAVQNFVYRDTGVNLVVKPTVHASGFVDIEISQQLSEAGEVSAGGNPIILNRSIQTTVTLRDGGSVLIGGLISSTSSEGNSGVPVLGRLPLLGKLFRTDTNSQNRTELMVMIIPYILSSPDEASALTDELQKQRIFELSN